MELNLHFELQKHGYYATEDLALDVSLLIPGVVDQTFQDMQKFGISSACLTGLPGVGKTFLPETLAKMLGWKYIAYSCDSKTGAEQLKEDLNIREMMKKNPDTAVTEGIIIQIINAVNNGEKVVAVIDEYDKSPEEADYFWLEILQSGRTHSSSYGNLQIDPDKMNNLVLFFIKNDVRDVHEALMRRFTKYLPITPPDVPTVRKICKEAVPNADTTMLEAALSIYSMILADAERFKKIATIQEVKNALVEDIVLKKWAKSEQIRLKNAINHLAKYEEDREFLRAKLKEQGLIELQEEYQKQEEIRFNKEAFENFMKEGAMDIVYSLQSEVEELKMLIRNGMVKTVGGEEGELLQNIAATAPESDSEEWSVEDEITALGTMSNLSVNVTASLPKSVYNPRVIALTKKAKTFEDGQYCFAELVLDRKKGRMDQLVHAITTAKATMSTENISYDGFVLDKSPKNTIGLVHYMETEGMPPRILLVSQEPTFSDQQLFKALRAIPAAIRNMTKIAEMDANVITGRSFEQIRLSLDHIYSISADETQIVGNKSGVQLRFDSDSQLLKLKVPRERDKMIPVEALLQTATTFSSDEETEVESQFERNLAVVSVEEIFEIASSSDKIRLGRKEDAHKEFEAERIQGKDVRVFAKNELDEIYGVEYFEEAEEFITANTNITAEEFKKKYAVIRFDGDNEFRILQKDDMDDENAFWCNYTGEHGQSVGTFVKDHRLMTTKDNEIEKLVEKMNEEFRKKQSQTA